MSKNHVLACALFLIAGCGVIPAFAASQIDIPGPSGSGKFGTTVTVLPNGNFVVTDPNYSIPAGAANVGAVYLYDGATLAVISTLTGSTANDQVGNSGIKLLTNGNFVVSSTSWNNGVATIAGAITWGSATIGIGGTVAVGNSLIGGTAGDSIGNGTVTAMTNGNYVVSSPSWHNGATANAGAATWGNGSGGTAGLVSSGNSLIGGTALDQIGNAGVKALTNGNYVVISSAWDNPTGPIVNVGAVTWGNGNGGTVGLVTPSNSLIGGTASDQVGGGGVTVLTNGNYAASSNTWDNPAGPIADVGAVTWCNGSGGTVGLVTPSNSLVGGTVSDFVGISGVTALSNGNYVVRSELWDNPTGPVSNVGAATWCNGSGGTVGLVTSSNSLVGGRASDTVGTLVTALTNGNYVVASQNWDNPTGPITDVGAVTWSNGNGGTVGLVSSGNSLIGGTASDFVGTGVTALTNGNYVVRSPNWDNPTGPIANVGAATWGNGSGGTVGLVTSSNSLVGGTANDSVGNGGVTALSNGNYVVDNLFWRNPTGPVLNAGAVTWCSGSSSTSGLVTSSNSLIGGTAGDNVGSTGVTALTNGNYVVRSSNWDNSTGPIVDVGAVTWGNGNGGTVGLVTSSNSLIGGTANDNVGITGVTAFTNGNYAVQSNNWDNPAGPVVNACAVTLGDGTVGTVGLITSADSVLGTVTNGISNFPGFSFDSTRNRLFVGRAASNIVTIFVPFVAAPLAFSSNPIAVPKPAGIGQTLTFTATATGGVGTLTYSWDFGESSPAALGASVTHAYATAGNFTATVTATDTTSGSISSTVMVTVNATVVGTGNDSDGDGFSDSFEMAVGTDPNSAGSTPTGMSATAGGIQALTISKVSIKLNFVKPVGGDSILFSGTLAVPAGFIANGAKVYFDAGGVAKVLTLTAKGNAKSRDDSLKVSFKSKKGGVLLSPAAKYIVSFKKGSFAGTLANEGLTNSDAKSAPVMVQFTFIFNNIVYRKMQTMRYTAKKGKTGNAK